MEPINISDIYKKLKEIEKKMATKKELAEAMETFCILSNDDTIKQIKLSESDIQSGKFKRIKSTEDL